MTPLKKILLLCDSLERYRFMNRLYESIPGDQIVFITGEPIVKLKTFLKGQKCIFVRSKKIVQSIEIDNNIEALAAKTIDVLNGDVTLQKAKADIIEIIDRLNKYYDAFLPDLIIIWNGQQILGRALTLYSTRNNISTKYLELSNLPNKLFCDSQGVNALSSIGVNPALIDNYPVVDSRVHATWVSNYVNLKKKPLPQTIKKKKYLIESFLNRLLKSLLKGVGYNRLKLQDIKNPKKNIDFSKIIITDELPKESFVFLALQVSNDTQIKLHSKVNNCSAIKKAFFHAKERKLKLVVKLHPAETCQKEVDHICTLQNDLGFIISNKNTIELINSSSEVSTINSTVGLESMIFDKKVNVYGNSHYAHFNKQRLLKYIHHFLIDDVDYFSKEKISKKAIKKILE